MGRSGPGNIEIKCGGAFLSVCFLYQGLNGVCTVQESKEWVEKVLKLDFETVIPAHTASPVSDGKKAFEECFDFLLVPGS